MADFIGVISGVIGIVSQAITEIETLVDRCQAFRAAPAEFRDLKTDCHAVRESLTHLANNLRDTAAVVPDDVHRFKSDALTVETNFKNAEERCRNLEKYFLNQRSHCSGFRASLVRLKQALFRFLFAQRIARECQYISRIVKDAHAHGTELNRFLNVTVQINRVENHITHVGNQVNHVEVAMGAVDEMLHTIDTDAKHVATCVEEVAATVQHVDVGVRDVDNKVGTIETEVKHVGDGVRLMDKKMDIFLRVADHTPMHSNDEFTSPKYPCVPDLSPKIILDFTTCNAENKPVTMEGKLKRALLDIDSRRKISRVALAVGAYGKGGIGKTNALLGIGWDNDVREQFKRGGIYFLSFGMDAGVGDVIEQLALAVKNSGGAQRAKDIRASKTLRDAIQIVQEWFRGRETLFLCDDVWETAQSSVGYFKELRQLLTSCGRSHMVLSTRDQSIAKAAGVPIKFAPRDPQGKLSRAILLEYAEISEEELPGSCGEGQDAIRRILHKCSGFPLTLGVAGRAIQTKAGNCDDGAPTAILMYAEELETSTRKMMTEDIDGYPNLCATVWSSLEMVNRWAEKKQIYGENDEALLCSDLFTRMSVFPRQSRVPQRTVKKLWGGLNHVDVSRVIDKLVDLNLLWKSEDKANGVTVGLHDLILEYCAIQARRNPRSFQRDFLGEYLTFSNDVMALSATVEDCSLDKLSITPEPRSWWSLSSDGYFPDNVCWHLWKGGCVGELVGLLCDIRWTVFRMGSGGLLKWESDFETLNSAIAEVKKEEGQEEGWDIFEIGVRLVREAVKEAWGYLKGNERELGMQVHSRLFDVDDGVWPVSAYLRSVRSHCQKPWLLPRGRYWPRPAEGASVELLVGEAVSDVAMIKNGALVAAAVGKNVRVIDVESRKVLRTLIGHEEHVTSVCINDDGAMIVSGSKDGTLRRWDGRTGMPMGEPLRGHRDKISCVAMSVDGTKIVSGSTGGTLRIWDGRTGAAICEPLREHSDRVTCVAMSMNGKIIVSGSEDKTLRRWNTTNGAAMGEPLRGHDDHVTCVVISEDGATIVSGSKDRTLRQWDGRNGAALGEPLYGHDKQVTCIAMSGDAATVVSGSCDMSLRRWNLKTGAIGGPLRGHHRQVSCVAMSEDGMMMVSGSHDDGTLCLWKRSVNVVREPLCSHDDDVTCVAMTEDGAMIVSGAKNGTLRRWNGKTGAPKGDSMCGHTDGVYAIAMSNDGAAIVSGSKDGTLRRWDGRTGAIVGEPLVVHGYVSCVAMSRDGTIIVSVSHETVQLWDARIGVEIGRLVLSCSLKGIEIDNDFVLGRMLDGSFIRWRIDKTCGLVDEKKWERSGESAEGHCEWMLQGLKHQLILEDRTRKLVLATLLGAVSTIDYKRVSFREERIGGDIGESNNMVSAVIAAGLFNGTVCIFHLITE